VTAPRVLTLVSTTAAGVSVIALLSLLIGTPAFECGPDYESPPTPLESKQLAFWAFVVGVVSLLVSIGVRLGAGPGRWQTRAIGASAAAVALGGIAWFVALGRWTCWP
jgi:hypothetical protein